MAECQTSALLLCYLTCIHGRVSKKCYQYLFLSLILWMSSRALSVPDLYSSFTNITTWKRKNASANLVLGQAALWQKDAQSVLILGFLQVVCNKTVCCS